MIYDFLFVVRKTEGEPEHIVIPSRYEFLREIQKHPEISKAMDSEMSRSFNLGGVLHIMTYTDVEQLRPMMNPEVMSGISLGYYTFCGRQMTYADVNYLLDENMFGNEIVLNVSGAIEGFPEEKALPPPDYIKGFDK